MSVIESFLQTVSARIDDLTELTAYRVALANFDGAGELEDQRRLWHVCFSDAQSGMSPTYNLRKAIRELVLDEGASLSVGDREAAYRELNSRYIQQRDKPMNDDQQRALLQDLFIAQMAE